MFKNAIVKTPSISIIKGISSASLGLPDYKIALKQHKRYKSILEFCGLSVLEMEKNENFPDSVFVEDTAVIIDNVALITNPGADSRKGEIHEMEKILKKYFNNIEKIEPPGTLDGGDVMLVERSFFVGISERTDMKGFSQFKRVAENSGFECFPVQLKNLLHLKTGVSYIGNNTILVTSELKDFKLFEKFRKLEVSSDESYAANSLKLNEYVVVPFGYKKTKSMIKDAGFKTLECDVSEFRKVDGGLSCLSIRF